MRIKGRLQMTARRIVSDEAVDDALQDAFVRLWSRRSDFDSATAVEGVAVTTVRNICIDTLRRDAVRRHDDIDDNPSAAVRLSPKTTATTGRSGGSYTARSPV